jgi:predicted metal-dependent hydrolase
MISSKLAWSLRKVRVRRRKPKVNPHYRAHKEIARVLVHEKLLYWNSICRFTYKRVAIRNTKGNWGSCTSLKNLNFNYKILFLPPHLQDYIVVHELCHLQELHHGASFWNLVELYIPEYKQCITELKVIEKTMHTSLVSQHLESVQVQVSRNTMQIV